ncbi:MAG: hypothetical protein CMH69_10335 [Nitratireductor sp.]|nr:hypothetical protein [Nitratireductor sp.]
MYSTGLKPPADKRPASASKTDPSLETNDRLGIKKTDTRTSSETRVLAQIFKCSLSEEMRKEIATFSQTIRREAPNIHALARTTMGKIVKEISGQDADPDKLFLNTFGSAASTTASFTGWEHTGQPISSVPLTDLLLQNFSADQQYETSDDLNVFEGVYTEGAGESYYGAPNEFRISIADLRDAIWKEDFQPKVLEKIRSFWEHHKDEVTALAKVQFATSAIEAVQQSQLSLEGLSLAMKGAGARTDKYLSAIAGGIGSETDQDVKTLTFDINGYAASDILRFVGSDGHTVLYVPGETPAFHEFKDNASLESWVKKAADSPEQRAQLEHHFSIYNLQDGLWYTGVENGLKKLGSHQWVSGINSKSRAFSADPFADIALNMQERSLSDADTLIKSDSEVTRDTWIDMLRGFNKMFWPLLMLAPEIEFAVLAVTMGNEIGLEIDKAVSGDTYGERKEGFYGAASTGGMVLAGAALGAVGRSLVETKAFAAEAGEEIMAGAVEMTAPEPALKIGDISDYQVDASVISGRGANGADIYQVDDRYYISVKNPDKNFRVYEIRSDFKLRDGYVNVIDPNTRKSVAILHNDGSGDWRKISGAGGGVDRPPYVAQRAADVRQEINRRGYVVANAPGEDANFDTIEKLKEQVDSLRFKLEDLGREPEKDGLIGNYRIVYRVDNVSPRILLRDNGFRPSKDFFAVSNLIDAPATIGSASLSANNNVLDIWQADPEDGVMYQYAIKMHNRKAGSFVDGGGWDHEFMDEVHFPPPPAKDVFLIDSSNDWARKLIADIADSDRFNTSYGIPLDVFEDYRTGRITLNGSEAPELPRGSSVSAESGVPQDSLESFDTKLHGQKRTRDWLETNAAEPTPGPSRAMGSSGQRNPYTGTPETDAHFPTPPDYEDTAYERTQHWVSQNMIGSEMNHLVLNDAPQPHQIPSADWVKAYEHSKDL